MRFYFKKNQSLVMLALLLFPFFSHAQIQVNAVNTVPITCPNNGMIIVSATTTSPPLLYSIIAGPVVQPPQTNFVFTSLLPGNYTVKITDGAGAETTVSANVTGTYQNPDFTIAPTTPFCDGESNGKLAATNITGTGLAPFSWQLVAPSPVTTGVQSDGTFENLPAGNYAIRVTDACGSFSTDAFTLQDPDTRFGFWGQSVGEQGEFLAAKIGCDSMLITYWMNIPNPRMPLTFSYPTPNGTFVPTSGTTIDTTNLHINGQVMVSQIIPGLDYGDATSAHIFNACGDSATTMLRTIHPFVFYPSYSYNGCGATAQVSYTNTPFGDYHTSIHTQAGYSLTNVATGTLVQSGTVTVQQNNGIVSITPSVVPGQTYHFSITDGCGETFESDFTVPSLALPQITNEYIFSGACIDSVVGTYYINTFGFSLNAQLILLSGPSTLGSTKPEFEYSDTYSYPDTIPASGTTFMMNNLAAGTYQYKIIDDCGNLLFDSITITSQQVTSLKRTTLLERGCQGHNKIFYSMICGGNVVIRNTANNNIVANRDFIAYNDNNQAAMYNRDSVINLADGTYEVTYQFVESPVSQYVKDVNDSDIPCWILVDTVVIAPYQFPQMTTGNVIMCNNEIHLELIPDTTKGVAPYQYEIISGPQNFPVQSSNVFTVTQPGIYVARIFDICGNASTKQIAVDTLSFHPVAMNTSCNHAHMVFPSSTFSTYEWLMPNNQVYVGDSLIFDPVTPADTGIYHVSQIININGCVDTLHTSYHVTLNNYLAQTIPFCNGTAVHVGTSIYNTPGIYHDTLTSISGCDSIVVTTLMVSPIHADTLHVSICQQETYLFGGTSYGNTGFYNDTLTSVQGCDSILTLSLIVHPYKYNTINQSICQGSDFVMGGNNYNLPGLYRDTLPTATCDSVITLNLTVLANQHNTITQSICQGSSYTVGSYTHSLAGIYTDTIASVQGCDSIVTLTLTVLPNKYNTITQSICQGSSYVVGNHTHTQSGIYTDTIASAQGCDSIITLNLKVLPYKHSAITQNICQGDSYTLGGHTYTLPGVYTDTLSTATCDSIVALTLNVLPRPVLSTDLHPFYCYQTGAVQLSPSPAGGTLTGDFVVGTELNLAAAAPGNYAVTYNYTGANGCESTLTASFLVTAPLAPDFTYSSDCFQKVSFSNTTQPAVATNTYSWDLIDGGGTSTAVNPSMIYAQPGDYLVTLVATDSYHCAYTVTKPVSVAEGADINELVIPNVITANGDGVNDVLSLPATMEACLDYKILILNRWGNLVYEMSSAQNAFSGLDKEGKELTPGVYFYILESADIDCENEYKGFCSGIITIVR